MKKSLSVTITAFVVVLLCLLGSCSQEPSKHTVSFDLNGHGGGDDVQPQTIELGKKVSEPEKPVDDDYDFVGWFKESDCINQWTFTEDTVSSNLILYAKWIEKEIPRYTVSFDSNGHGTAPLSQEMERGGNVSEPESLKEENYLFQGWYEESDCINIWSFVDNTVSKDIKLFAKWIPCEHIHLSDGIALSIATNNIAPIMQYTCDDCGKVLTIEDNLTIDNSLSISFSHDSCFSNEPFDLTITATDGSTIYYTLDGSIPTESSFVYEGPIHITDASSNPNVYSNITTGLSLNVLPIVPPTELIDKCTVLRAICVKDGHKSEVKTASFFVGFNSKAGYDNINILSIVTDPTNLFDYNNGIYVVGGHDNYLNKGKEWERESAVSFFNTERTLILSRFLGIRIKGAWSRGIVPRSLNIYARDDYDGKKNFGVSLWNDHESYTKARKITLASGGDDYVVNVVDYIIGKALAASDEELKANSLDPLHFSYFHFSPYALFLNGEYWGSYFITENYDDHYLAQHFNVDNKKVLVVKNGELEEGKEEEDLHLYEEMRDLISNTDMSIPANYSSVCETIDINSFIDYYAAEMFVINPDWPHNNYEAWRTIENDSSPYGDCKWRWLLFDTNMSLSASPNTDYLESVKARDLLFNNLWANDAFKESFCERMLFYANDVFDPSKMSKIVDDFIVRMITQSAKKYRRFFGSENYLSTFVSKCSSIKSFFNRRKTYIVEKYTSILNEINQIV